MFDYVSRKDFDEERALRIRAEATAEAARAQLDDLNEQIAQLTSLVERERARHQEMTLDLLDRYSPKPPDRSNLFLGASEGSAHLSSAEIRRMPAVGKRGMAERNRRLAEAEAREMKEEDEGAADERRATLSPEEQKSLEKSIPGRVN